jgi:fumarate hydratase, class II
MTPTRGQAIDGAAEHSPTAAESAMRTEYDSFGEVQVPADAYWGAQTQRAVKNFAVGERTMPLPIIHAYGLLKAAAARVNARHQRLDQGIADAIAAAAQEVAAGVLDAQFPISPWQTGSGTQTHMNVNEVIAHRANEMLGHPLGSHGPVHPNDHVNLGQSSNDTFPTVMHLAVLAQTPALLASLEALASSVSDKAVRWTDVVTIGRTHLQDAVPMTVGAQWRAYGSMLRAHAERVDASSQGLRALALGGTAVGTGLNAFAGFADEVCQDMASSTGIAVHVADDLPYAMSMLDPLVAFSASLRGLAVGLLKFADDIRLLASGPRTAIHEIVIPANEPGSSIMPGKVNPTLAEMVVMVCIQSIASDAAVAHAGSHGELQLNVMRPVVALNVLDPLALLTGAMTSLRSGCIDGLELDRQRIDANVERSPMLVTALAPHIGYDAAARIAKASIAQDISLRQAALADGVDADLYDRVVDPERMARAEE